ncbi:hypothetical protein B0A55_05113 [Friedmanniomyces simplex]|uniref:Tachykinin family protein n=1 Tax=Friedmanniomyces simplex TaxID=329884 RepID=A0A4U0XKI5_9PEZI|nr:hypothetical protein B0A55_05113 [Friedmanniomyces simplex]
MAGSKDMRFVVISNPEQLRNRAELRLNRQHVMKTYLAKEASKPASNDIRVTGKKCLRRRKPANPPSPATTDSSGNLHGASNANAVTPGSGHDFSAPQTCQHVHPRDNRNSSAAKKRTATRPKINKSRSVKARSNPKSDTGPLVPGISGRFRNYAYLGTDAEEVPFPLHHLGGDLNPFDTWPTFDDPSLNVNELKWSCSKRFGSRGIADYWVPTLLKARHAFLSTIAISSCHDDIMRRSARPPGQRPKHESVQRARVRQEVTSMINQSMSDPQMQTSDATMVAVVHLLNAEIMGCDDHFMRVHQQGLSAMDCRPLPESPVYFRPLGYRTIYKVFAPESHVSQILELARRLTAIFETEVLPNQSPSEENSHTHHQDQTNSEQLLAVTAAAIFIRPAAEDLSFALPSESYTYEAIRLTARLYAHALLRRIPFSRAAQELQATASSSSSSYRSLQPGTLSTEAAYMANCAIIIHIRNALVRTDTTDCWGGLIGVLFWIALVAGAAANPEAVTTEGGYKERQREGGSGGGGGEEEEEEEEEEARKWLAAVGVRCSIVLGFEFGPAVMGTVKRVVGIQRVLGRLRTVNVSSEGCWDSSGVGEG